MSLDEFLRLYPLRSSTLAWFLGAGASASARLPTAWDLVWRFKQTLYCTSSKVSRSTCEDLGNEVVRERLQRYLDSAGKYPQADSPEEYATYFEATYPDPNDRRRFIENMLLGAKPAFGHHILAGLMKAGKIRLAWTTNFDRLIEDATAKAFGSTSALTVSTIDSSSVAIRALNEGSWPMLGKLHGDFQSVALKNTTEELKTQESALRMALVESCKRFGLVVAGYSGRDESVMQALEEALNTPNAFPSGFFWMCRAGSPVYSRVKELIEKAAKAGIKAHLVETETFDELMGDVAQQFQDLPAEMLGDLNKMRSRVSNVPLTPSAGMWPVVRMNAVPILSWPSACRKFSASIGGARELKDLLRKSDAQIVAARSQRGILAFGCDAEVKRIFSDHKPEDFGIHSIEVRRLWRETNELNLLRSALAKGLADDAQLALWAGRGMHELRVLEALQTSDRLGPLRAVVKAVAGKVPGTDIQWAEAVNIRMEYRMERLWLLLEPTVWFSKTASDDERYICGEFVRERKARRYNMIADSLLSAWLSVLIPGGQEVVVSAYKEQPGIEAQFLLSRRTAYSRRSS